MNTNRPLFSRNLRSALRRYAWSIIALVSGVAAGWLAPQVHATNPDNIWPLVLIIGAGAGSFTWGATMFFHEWRNRPW